MSTVSRNGQVPIPKSIRDRLKLRPGAKVDFEPTPDGRFVLVKVGKKRTARVEGRFDRIRGVLKGDMTTDEIMALMRGGN